MKKVRWVSATAGAAMVAATLALPGASVAYAADSGNVTGNGNASLLSGNLISAPINVPVNLCGLSLAVLGFSNSGCAGGASTQASGSAGGGNGNGNVNGDGNASAASGNTISVPVNAPVNLCGVSAAVGGFANSHCAGGAGTQGTEPAGGGSGNGNVNGDGNTSAGSGNTISVPVNAPVNVCGVPLAVLGFAETGCHGSAVVNPPTPPVCEGDQCTPPVCQGNDCTPPGCHGDNCPPPPGCQGNDCTPADCHGDHCPPPVCQGNCAPPACQGNCAPPTGPGTPPTVPGNPGGVTTVTTATMPSSGLPTTGADLLLLGVAAIGSIGVGAGAGALARRRRNGAVR